jgi:uncharacterized Zn-binding protein involved in type VI secretion
MRAVLVLASSLTFAAAAADLATAQDPPAGALGVITKGSGTTSVGGQPAARQGDATTDGAAIVEGSKDVFIDGKPAVTLGDKTGCGGVTVGGASNVFINGKPVARTGDLTTGCPGK